MTGMATGVTGDGPQSRGSAVVALIVVQGPGAVQSRRTQIVRFPCHDITCRIAHTTANAFNSGVHQAARNGIRCDPREVAAARVAGMENTFGAVPLFKEPLHVHRQVFDYGKIFKRGYLQTIVLNDLAGPSAAGPAWYAIHLHGAGTADADPARVPERQCRIQVALDIHDDVKYGLVGPRGYFEIRKSAFRMTPPYRDFQQTLGGIRNYRGSGKRKRAITIALLRLDCKFSVLLGGPMPNQALTNLRALTFDVFGTVVDWRSSIIEQGTQLNLERGWQVNWTGLVDAWRARYQPSMAAVRDGRRAWVELDTLHRESLQDLAPQFGMHELTDDDLDHITGMWHRLDPWPDTLPGLTRLRRHFILVTLSNGNVALLVNMAKRAGLPWDAVLGAEVVRCYKPLPEAYLGTARLLGLSPSQCMMVAAHNDDLAAARGCGMRTAFVRRPIEYGPDQNTDLAASSNWDVVAEDLLDLATQLGCI